MEVFFINLVIFLQISTHTETATFQSYGDGQAFMTRNLPLYSFHFHGNHTVLREIKIKKYKPNSFKNSRFESVQLIF
jgi:hypothetical protein